MQAARSVILTETGGGGDVAGSGQLVSGACKFLGLLAGNVDGANDMVITIYRGTKAGTDKDMVVPTATVQDTLDGWVGTNQAAAEFCPEGLYGVVSGDGTLTCKVLYQPL